MRPVHRLSDEEVLELRGDKLQRCMIQTLLPNDRPTIPILTKMVDFGKNFEDILSVLTNEKLEFSFHVERSLDLDDGWLVNTTIRIPQQSCKVQASVLVNEFDDYVEALSVSACIAWLLARKRTIIEEVRL